MAEVGDQIIVTSRGQPRSGVVTAVGNAMITVRWNSGGETSIVPGPGVLTVVGHQSPEPDAKPASETKVEKAKKAKKDKGKSKKDKKAQKNKGKKAR